MSRLPKLSAGGPAALSTAKQGNGEEKPSRTMRRILTPLIITRGNESSPLPLPRRPKSDLFHVTEKSSVTTRHCSDHGMNNAVVPTTVTPRSITSQLSDRCSTSPGRSSQESSSPEDADQDTNQSGMRIPPTDDWSQSDNMPTSSDYNKYPTKLAPITTFYGVQQQKKAFERENRPFVVHFLQIQSLLRHVSRRVDSIVLDLGDPCPACSQGSQSALLPTINDRNLEEETEHKDNCTDSEDAPNNNSSSGETEESSHNFFQNINKVRERALSQNSQTQTHGNMKHIRHPRNNVALDFGRSQYESNIRYRKELKRLKWRTAMNSVLNKDCSAPLTERRYRRSQTVRLRLIREACTSSSMTTARKVISRHKQVLGTDMLSYNSHDYLMYVKKILARDFQKAHERRTEILWEEEARRVRTLIRQDVIRKVQTLLLFDGVNYTKKALQMYCQLGRPLDMPPFTINPMMNRYFFDYERSKFKDACTVHKKAEEMGKHKSQRLSYKRLAVSDSRASSAMMMEPQQMTENLPTDEKVGEVPLSPVEKPAFENACTRYIDTTREQLNGMLCANDINTLLKIAGALVEGKDATDSEKGVVLITKCSSEEQPPLITGVATETEKC